MSAYRSLRFLLSAVAAAICGTTIAEGAPRAVNGVYHFHNGYQCETLELRDGHFRYWSSTDYAASSGGRAIEGTYLLDGATLMLQGPKLHLGNKRIFHSFRGIEALWRPYALRGWLRKKGLNTFGIMFRLPHPPEKLDNSYFPLPAAAEKTLQDEFRESKDLVDDGGAGLLEEFRERPK